MSLPPLLPLQDFVNVIQSIVTTNIEQKALLLDIAFGLKSIIISPDHIQQIIYLGDLFKMEEYVYHVFKGHDKLEFIQQMYVEVHKYV